MAKIKQAAAAAAVAAAVTAPVGVSAITANDKAAAEFFMLATETLETLGAAVNDARDGIWSGAVELYSGAGFTWEGVQVAAPELVKRKAYTSTKAQIIAAVAAGVALVDSEGKARGKGRVHGETQAKALGVNPLDAEGKEKTIKALSADIKAAKGKADEGGEGDSGNKGESVKLTLDQMITLTFDTLKAEPAMLVKYRRDVGALVLKLQELDAAKVQRKAA